jgi:hypothetical protein
MGPLPLVARRPSPYVWALFIRGRSDGNLGSLAESLRAPFPRFRNYETLVKPGVHIHIRNRW